MTGLQIRNACKPIAEDLKGVKITVIGNDDAISDSPAYCMMDDKDKVVVFNRDLLPADILQKPELLMLNVEHEIQHFLEFEKLGYDSLMADYRYDRQAIERLIQLAVDITKINPLDFDALLENDKMRLDRVNQLSNYINQQSNG